MSKAPSDNQYFGTEKTMKILFRLAPPVITGTTYSIFI